MTDALRFLDALDVYASPRYTQAVEVRAGARTVHVSGQVGVAPDGTTAEGFEAQARRAFANLFAQLAAAGMGPTDLVKMTAIVTDPANVAAFRAIRAEVMGEHRPASTLLVAGLAEPQWLVEIEAVAARD